MPSVPLFDQHAARVGDLVRDAFQQTLGDGLVCVAAHGSAVTGYLPGFSDFDFVVFMRGRLSIETSLALQSRLGEADIKPFTYLQVSRIHDMANPGEQHTGLIDGVYATLYGQIPAGWTFHDEDSLRLGGRTALQEQVQRRWHARLEDWAVEGGARRTNRVRLFMTDVKPATRAILVEFGEPVMEIWGADYWELARRLHAHDENLAARLEQILRGIPAIGSQEQVLGADILTYLDDIGERARGLGVF